MNHHQRDWMLKQPACNKEGCSGRSKTAGLCHFHYMEAYPRARAARSWSSKKYFRTPKGRWTRHISSAKTRHYVQELTFEQFCELTSKPCVYCGRFSYDQVSGIDRIDNAIGYTLANCEPCCAPCNLMKQNIPREDFIRHVLAIADFQRAK